MCTVVYIPSKSASYFASLRDENPARATAIAPVLNSENSVKYISPVDSLYAVFRIQNRCNGSSSRRVFVTEGCETACRFIGNINNCTHLTVD